MRENNLALKRSAKQLTKRMCYAMTLKAYILQLTKLGAIRKVCPAKISSPFLCTAPLVFIPKIQLTRAEIDCLINDKTKNPHVMMRRSFQLYFMVTQFTITLVNSHS